MKTYVINLPESAERREYIRKETAKYPFMDVELMTGVRGKALTEKETEQRFDRKRFIRRYSRLPDPGEMGCTLSHRKCYEALLASDEEVALILEDDASFIRPDDTKEIIEACSKRLKEEDTDLFLFMPQACYYTKPQVIAGSYNAYPIYEAYETCGYMIGRRGAEKLLRIKRPCIVADDFVYMCGQGVKIKCVLPNIIVGLSTEGKMKTDINDERKNRVVNNPYYWRIWKRITQFVFWKKRLFLMRGGWLADNGIYDQKPD